MSRFALLAGGADPDGQPPFSWRAAPTAQTGKLRAGFLLEPDGVGRAATASTSLAVLARRRRSPTIPSIPISATAKPIRRGVQPTYRISDLDQSQPQAMGEGGDEEGQ